MPFDLPTLEEGKALRSNAKPQKRIVEKAQKRASDEKALDEWRRQVRHRDRMRCRVCGRKVIVTLELVKNRAECHHIIGRAHRPTRTDRRNGLLCCPGCHEKLQHRDLVVVADSRHTFTLDETGRVYINADFPVEFWSQGGETAIRVRGDQGKETR